MKKFFGLLAIILAITVTGCGKGDPGERGADGAVGAVGPAGPQGEPAPTPTVTAEEQDILNLVSDENDYRLYLGQTELSAGLSCTVQQVASGQWLSSSSPGYNSGQGVVTMTGPTYSYLYKGDFTQANSSGSAQNLLLPAAVRPLFVNVNYRIVCSGQIVVTETGYYDFALNSDDGSILTVDGTQVINNDGNHGMVLKHGTKLLRRGVRTFSLQYAQTGSGNFGLELTASDSPIPSNRYYH